MVHDRRAALCRELTKLHEDVWRDSLGALAERAANEKPRGEVTIVVAGDDASDASAPTMSLDAARAEVDRLVGEGMSRSSAAREVAQSDRSARRELFKNGR